MQKRLLSSPVRLLQVMAAMQFATVGLCVAHLPDPANDIAAFSVKGEQTAVLAGPEPQLSVYCV